MNRNNKHEFKHIELPHIGYTVIFKDLSYLKGVEKKGGAYTMAFDSNTSYVFVDKIAQRIKEPNTFPTLAHEIVHVLQNICIARMMDFEKENEHMAYIMQYILNEILGYSYVLKAKK